MHVALSTSTSITNGYEYAGHATDSELPAVHDQSNGRYAALRDAEITIPFPQREVRLK